MCIYVCVSSFSCHSHKTSWNYERKGSAFKVRKDDLAWFCLVTLKIIQIVCI